MKRKKKRLIALAIVLTMILATGTTVLAVVSDNDWFANGFLAENSSTKYDRPTIGAIVNDGAYPEAEKSDDSPNFNEKAWYEYITYSSTPIGESKTNDGNRKYVYYDPYDYSYGAIMKIGDVIKIPANSNIVEKYPTLNEYINDVIHRDDYREFVDSFGSKNSITICYSFSQNTTHSNSSNFGFEAEQEIGLDTFVDIKLKFKETFGTSISFSTDTSSSLSVQETYNAVYYNDDGAPYQWRVVHYTVYIPIKCDVYEKNANGDYEHSDTIYVELATIQGTCREFIKEGVTYVEDWRNGESIAVEDFWKQFFTEETLKSLYKDKLMPVS